MAQTYFSEGKENFHVNKDTVNFIMDQFFRYYTSETVNKI